MIGRTRLSRCKNNIIAIVCFIELVAGKYGWSAVGAWSIAPPRANREWQQLAQLVVASFDAPNPRPASAMEWWTWNLFQKRQCLRQTYQQYTRTARRMRHMKHTILLAKDDQGRVIGMVEMGISSSTSSDAAVEAACGDYDNMEDSTATAGDAGVLERKRRPTIGVLCVDADYRQRGVAKDLVDRCIHIVANHESWTGGPFVDMKYHAIYAEVEPDNAPALAFFASQGFVIQSTNCWQNVTVRRRNRVETRPHLLLGKHLHPAVSSFAETNAATV
jgi:ribosomal protein S18 acetylase RimI-like enzyme